NREDVRVRERRDSSGLPFEPAAPVGVLSELRGKNLDGDIAPQPRVSRPIDLTHSAFADLGEQAIRSECITDVHRRARLRFGETRPYSARACAAPANGAGESPTGNVLVRADT